MSFFDLPYTFILCIFTRIQKILYSIHETRASMTVKLWKACSCFFVVSLFSCFFLFIWKLTLKSLLVDSLSLLLRISHSPLAHFPLTHFPIPLFTNTNCTYILIPYRFGLSQSRVGRVCCLLPLSAVARQPKRVHLRDLESLCVEHTIHSHTFIHIHAAHTVSE